MSANNHIPERGSPAWPGRESAPSMADNPTVLMPEEVRCLGGSSTSKGVARRPHFAAQGGVSPNVADGGNGGGEAPRWSGHQRLAREVMYEG
jgi:hypothetical protein